MDRRRRNGPLRARPDLQRAAVPPAPLTVESEMRLSTAILDALCDVGDHRSPVSMIFPAYLALLRIHHAVHPSYSMSQLHVDLSLELSAEIDALESRGWCIQPPEDEEDEVMATMLARSRTSAPN